MAEGSSSGFRPTDPVGRMLFAISRVLAVLGGLVLFGMAGLTAVSVTGRAAFSAPIPGDFELVSIGIGVSIFAFLPYCQITRSNVIVDFFMVRASTRVKALCDTVGALVYLVIGAILTWRLTLGGLDMYHYSERTMTINFPRWTTFPISVLLMMFLVVVIAYTVWRSIAEARAGRFFDQD
jgi:TRAP-type C4-dicarboxylate transport system permease small subunit